MSFFSLQTAHGKSKLMNNKCMFLACFLTETNAVVPQDTPPKPESEVASSAKVMCLNIAHHH